MTGRWSQGQASTSGLATRRLSLCDDKATAMTTSLSPLAITLIGFVVLLAVGVPLAIRLVRLGADEKPPEPMVIEGAPLSATLRALSDEATDAHLVVTWGSRRADLFMTGGKICHAIGIAGVGNAVVVETLRWDSGATKTVVMRGVLIPPDRTVSLPLEELIVASGTGH